MLLMARKPAPVVIRFIARDAVNPRLQAAIAAEGTDIPKHFQKHFLYYIGGIARIIQEAVDETIHWLLVPVDQRFVRALGSLSQRMQQTVVGVVDRGRPRTDWTGV